MNRLLTIVVCAGFVLLSVVSMRAQDNNPPAVPKRKFKHKASIKSVYDEATKQTIVTTQWFYISEGIMKPRSLDNNAAQIIDRNGDPFVLGESLAINTGFAYPGRVLTSTPEAVEFHIRVTHRGVPLFKYLFGAGVECARRDR